MSNWTIAKIDNKAVVSFPNASIIVPTIRAAELQRACSLFAELGEPVSLCSGDDNRLKFCAVSEHFAATLGSNVRTITYYNPQDNTDITYSVPIQFLSEFVEGLGNSECMLQIGIDRDELIVADKALQGGVCFYDQMESAKRIVGRCRFAPGSDVAVPQPLASGYVNALELLKQTAIYSKEDFVEVAFEKMPTGDALLYVDWREFELELPSFAQDQPETVKAVVNRRWLSKLTLRLMRFVCPVIAANLALSQDALTIAVPRSGVALILRNKIPQAY